MIIMHYFILPNIGKICYEINGSNIIYKKEIDDKLVNLTKEENKKVKEYLNKSNSYIYYSIVLDNIILNNEDLVKRKTIISPLLTHIEKIIPEKYLQRFYDNVATLQIDYGLDIDNSKDIASEKVEAGSYHSLENKIIISRETIKTLYMFFQNNKDLFWKEYYKDLLHELFHMSSTSYDTETGIVLSGFDKFPTSDDEESNRGLTEGFTELLALICISSEYEKANGYYLELTIVRQLSLIIRPEILLDSYFGNKGVSKLKEELVKLDGDENRASILFKLIELNYDLSNDYGEQTVLGHIQSFLIEYFGKKILNDLKNDRNENEIKEDIKLYKKYLITEELLEYINKKPENYPNINQSIENFNILEDALKKYFTNLQI